MDPLLWPHSDYLTGPLVQVHVVAADDGGSSCMIAAGAALGSQYIVSKLP